MAGILNFDTKGNNGVYQKRSTNFSFITERIAPRSRKHLKHGRHASTSQSDAHSPAMQQPSREKHERPRNLEKHPRRIPKKSAALGRLKPSSSRKSHQGFGQCYGCHDGQQMPKLTKVTCVRKMQTPQTTLELYNDGRYLITLKNGKTLWCDCCDLEDIVTLTKTMLKIT